MHSPDPIDTLFREKLAQHSRTPQIASWEKLSQQLSQTNPPARSQAVWLWLRLVIVLTLLAVPSALGWLPTGQHFTLAVAPNASVSHELPTNTPLQEADTPAAFAPVATRPPRSEQQGTARTVHLTTERIEKTPLSAASKALAPKADETTATQLLTLPAVAPVDVAQWEVALPTTLALSPRSTHESKRKEVKVIVHLPETEAESKPLSFRKLWSKFKELPIGEPTE